MTGRFGAMSEENSLSLHIHELVQYLNRRGAATFMTIAQHGSVGDMRTPGYRLARSRVISRCTFIHLAIWVTLTSQI